MTTFEEIRTKPRRGQGCPVCGATNTGHAWVALRALREGTQTPVHVVGRSVSFCEEHATEVYLRLVQVLDESAGRS